MGIIICDWRCVHTGIIIWDWRYVPTGVIARGLAVCSYGQPFGIPKHSGQGVRRKRAIRHGLQKALGILSIKSRESENKKNTSNAPRIPRLRLVSPQH